MKSVVITGVSTGIGFATTQVLLAQGYKVFGSVRKQADADRLTRQLGANFVPMVFDVTDEAAVRAAAQVVKKALNGQTLGALVNNAGIVVDGPLLHVPSKDVLRQLEVNIVGPLIVTQAFAPLLGADRNLQGEPGRVLNIGSTVGKFAPPFMGPYVTSKFGLEGFTDTLRRELMLYGIDVILVGPGAVDTPIIEKTRSTLARVASDYDDALTKFDAMAAGQMALALSAEEVGQTILRILSARRPKARYSVVPRKLQAFMMFTLPLFLPKRTTDRMFSKMLGLVPAGQVKRLESSATAQRSPV